MCTVKVRLVSAKIHHQFPLSQRHVISVLCINGTRAKQCSHRSFYASRGRYLFGSLCHHGILVIEETVLFCNYYHSPDIAMYCLY